MHLETKKCLNVCLFGIWGVCLEIPHPTICVCKRHEENQPKQIGWPFVIREAPPFFFKVAFPPSGTQGNPRDGNGTPRPVGTTADQFRYVQNYVLLMMGPQNHLAPGVILHTFFSFVFRLFMHT